MKLAPIAKIFFQETDKTKKKSDGNSYAQLKDRIFAKMDKKLKKAFKSASCQKKRCYDSDSDSDSEQEVGLDSMGDLVRVERVGKIKSKKTKFDVYTPSDPIKTTHKHNSSKISENFSEQQNVPKPKQGFTAVMGVMVGLKPTHSNKVSKKKILRVLLDTGSDGDIISTRREQTNPSPT